VTCAALQCLDINTVTAGDVGTYTIFFHVTDDNTAGAAATQTTEVSFVLTITLTAAETAPTFIEKIEN